MQHLLLLCTFFVAYMYMYMLGASVSHVHIEAFLRTMSAVSIVTIEVALVALKSKLEVKMSTTKLPSCVTEDVRPAICVARA